jgi:Swt1-like HEPN
MINKELFATIQTKTKTSDQAIYDAIKRIRKSYSNSISKEEGVYFYAAKLGIDIYRNLRQEDQSTRDRVTSLIASPKNIISTIQKKKAIKSSTIKILSVKEMDISDPLLPPKYIEDAKKMAEIYPIIYLFENSVRNFIRLALDKAFPEGWWTEPRVTRDPFNKANSRKKDEGNNLWHGSRSSNMLDYVDLEELEKIINRNTETLTPYFKGLPKDLEWLKMKIKEIYPSRNIIAHCNPLSAHDIKRVQVICLDWQKQLPLLKSKLEE